MQTVSPVSFEDYEKLSVPESNTTPFIYEEKLVSLMRKQMYKILMSFENYVLKLSESDQFISYLTFNIKINNN